MHAIIFIGVLLVVVAILLLWPFGFSIKKSAYYFKNDPGGRDAITGIGLFLSVVIIAVLILSMFAPKAEGDEKSIWFEELSISAGLVRPIDGGRSSFCSSQGVDSTITSTGAIDLSVYRRGHFAASLIYEHHSCALNADELQVDFGGFVIKYTIPLRR